MNILSNYDLTKLNTFGISARARFFTEIHAEDDIEELFNVREFTKNSKLILGGGSNVLFTKDFDGIVVLNKLKGIEVLREDEETVLVRAMSGEVWHDLVLFAVNKGYWGVENLSFIPGTVGAAPMQNIGAYGAELKNVLENVEAIELATGARRTFSREECKLGYRDSIFKNDLKDKYFVLAITLKLSKIEQKNISYRILKDFLEQNNIEVKNSGDISKAVTAIRKSKLPDPRIISNAGSFFKNVFVEKLELERLQSEYPDIPYFQEGEVLKIPSAWLIEQCGPASSRQGGASATSWKGYRVGNVGVHERQALVIVNHGGATGAEVKNLAENICASVFEKFGLRLVPEVNLIP